jgi:hypothetical protein
MTTFSTNAVYQRTAAAGLLFFALASSGAAQSIDVTQKLDGFDACMAKTLKDRNAPGVGVGVGIVVNDKLVFAKGYGFRDECVTPQHGRTLRPFSEKQGQSRPCGVLQNHTPSPKATVHELPRQASPLRSLELSWLCTSTLAD